ncbi:MAG TPA: MlaD family protein [Solirubrobacteraceae bacterium]
MSRRPGTSVAANPVLIGAVTVLVVAVAVFLSYNANSGLPFVPSYEVKAVVPDAAELVPGNDVNVGGARVGQVTKVEAGLQGARQTPVAVLSMKLEKPLDPLPADTKVLIRQRSNVGLKFVELRLGNSRRGIPAGGSLPLRNAVLPVDLDDVVTVFDRPTRRATQETLSELGVGLTGRGADLNRTLEALPAVLRDLRAVSRNLVAPETDLRGFVRGVGSAVSAIAPVAEPLRELFDRGATTFAALERERVALGAAIEKSAATEREAAAGFAALRPLLREATGFVRDANPALRVLPRASRNLAAGLRASGPALGRARRIASPLDAFLARTRRLARMPELGGALRRLTTVVKDAIPLLTYVNPFQTKCNSLGLWFRNVPSIGSEGDAMGTWFRFTPPSNPLEMLAHPEKTSTLHYSGLPDVGQNGECEAGNEIYIPNRQVIGAVPGKQPLATESTIPGTLAQNIDHEFGLNGR